MGKYIAALVRLFDCAPDQESNKSILELAENPQFWSAAHAHFDEVRNRFLSTSKNTLQRQYSFEEDCCKALYNATDPTDPFDPSSAFFVVPSALALAEDLGVPFASVLAAVNLSGGAGA